MKKCATGLGAFREERFISPPSICYPGYFWFWNDRITRSGIFRQLRDMHRHKALSVCPIPMPAEFRPAAMGTNMEPDYLSPEYFEMFSAMVDRAAELGMDVWLYDEGGWPSGSACGKVVSNNPSLAKREMRLAEGELIETVVRPEDEDFPKPPYPDLLNPESTKVFVKLTHEAYKRAVGRHFGKTIRRMFTDEAKVSGVRPGIAIPWTRDMLEGFREAKGYDLAPYLKFLYGDPTATTSDKIARIRIDFFDFWSRRFVDSYFGTLLKWGRKNNLLSGGHIGGEHETLGGLKYGHGNTMGCLRKMDLPGVDTIWRELFPGRKNHHFPKYASSVAHQNGSKWAFTETFAVYGSGLTAEQMKWLTDYQYALGINMTVGAIYPYSRRGRYKMDIRPHFGPSNPLWDFMDGYHEYIGRLSYLLSLGKPLVRHALYYPSRDFWAGGSDLPQKVAEHDELAAALLDNLCDFDFVDDDILESKATKVVKGGLRVGRMTYGTVWLSRTKWMSDKARNKLLAFAASGGSVKTYRHRAKDAGLGEVSKMITSFKNPDKFRGIAAIPGGTGCDSGLRLCARKLENGNLYFIFNQSVKSISTSIRFNENKSAFMILPETGALTPIVPVRKDSLTSTYRLRLPFAGSCVFLFTDEKLRCSKPVVTPGATLLKLGAGWLARRKRSYRIETGEEPFVEVKESWRKVLPGDWGRYFGKEFSGHVEYLARFVCDKSIFEHGVVLDLGDVSHVCSVRLNGCLIGKRAWRPFVFDISGRLKKGRNELRVMVANTLANEVLSSKIFANEVAKHPGNVYHDVAWGFENETTESGLFGPVRICRETNPTKSDK